MFKPIFKFKERKKEKELIKQYGFKKDQWSVKFY